LTERLLLSQNSVMSETLGIGSQVYHETYGKGVIVEVNLGTYNVWFKNRGDEEISHRDDRMEIKEAKEADDGKLTLTEVESVFSRLLEKWADITHLVDLGSKWNGGTMSLIPGKEGLKSKDMPIEAFFHKIVMTRDRLRVMEQRINAHKVLSDEEKVNLQQYISRIYGSLTSFNVLFANSEDHFKGS